MALTNITTPISVGDLTVIVNSNTAATADSLVSVAQTLVNALTKIKAIIN